MMKIGEMPLGINYDVLNEDEIPNANFLHSGIFSLETYKNDFRKGLKLFQFSTEKLAEAYDIPPTQSIEDHKIRSETIELYHSWRRAAAYECCLSIYNFGKTIQGINTVKGTSKSLKRLSDQQLFKTTNKFFEQNFGKTTYIYARHALSHHAEKMYTPSEHKKNKYIHPEKNDFSPFNQEGNIPIQHAGSLISHDSNSCFRYTWGVNEFGVENATNGGALVDNTLYLNWANEICTLNITKETLHILEKNEELYLKAYLDMSEKARKERNAKFGIDTPE